MNRKEFFKQACGMGLCTCFGLGFLSKCSVNEPEAKKETADDTTPVVSADARQIQNLLLFIESNIDDPIRSSIFGQLGA